MDFDSVLEAVGYKSFSPDEITGKIPFLVKKFRETRISDNDKAGVNWIMGNLRKTALGNVSLSELCRRIEL
jgi:glutamyl-tRNA(Gln) amidotransferase subunit E